MTNVEDRRAQPRAGLDTPAIAYLADQRVECRAVDISIAGIALWSPIVREPGQFLRVNFSLSPPGGIPRWYDADGVVVRVGKRPTGVVLGVQFVVIDDRVARDVHGYVAETMQRTGVVRPRSPGAMPDAMHPPPVTGEFFPPEARAAATVPEAAPRRRTAEYGLDGNAAVDSTSASSTSASSSATPANSTSSATSSSATTSSSAATTSSTSTPRASSSTSTPAGPVTPMRARTNPPIPRSSVAAPTPTAPPSYDTDADTKRELERLYREALSEVDGKSRKRGK